MPPPPEGLSDFDVGEQQVFEAFDGYFLGLPKIQKIVIRTITEPNTMLASALQKPISVKSVPLQHVLSVNAWSARRMKSRRWYCATRISSVRDAAPARG